MKHTGLVVVIVFALGALAVFIGLGKTSGHFLQCTAYFQNAEGLRIGAPVRLAGVEIGSVESVQARPELRETPAEVVINIRTPYKLTIPKDSIATLATVGILGETYLEIDASKASGPALENKGVLATRAAKMPTADLLERLSELVKNAPCDSNKQQGRPQR